MWALEPSVPREPQRQLFLNAEVTNNVEIRLGDPPMPDNKKWIVLVYQAGDNNLSEEMVYALKEMRRIGTTPEFKERGRVLALFDPRGVPPRLYDFNIENPNPPDTDGDLERFSKEDFFNTLLASVKAPNE